VNQQRLDEAQGENVKVWTCVVTGLMACGVALAEDSGFHVGARSADASCGLRNQVRYTALP
jgi:hypothetical protein